MFFKNFIPDLYTDTIYDIDIEALKNAGIRAVISDIDNTLVPYSEPVPTESVSEWYEKIRKAGISVALVSNNCAERVTTFNGQTSYPAIADAHKPSKKPLAILMDKLGVKPHETVMLGDQIFTDVLSGRLAGTYCILVKPIKDRTDILTRSKRVLERPFLRAYKRKQSS